MKKKRFSVTSLVCGVLSLATALLYVLSVSRDHSPIVIVCMVLAGLCSLALCWKKFPLRNISRLRWCWFPSECSHGWDLMKLAIFSPRTI